MTLNRPFSPLLAIAWTITFVFGFQFLTSVAYSLRPTIDRDIVTLGMIEAVACLLVTAALVYLHGAPDRSLSEHLGLRPTHFALPVLAMLLGFTLHFPAEAVDIGVQRLFPQTAADLEREALLLTAPTLFGKAMILFIVACVGPLAEEVLFRGALFGTLRRSRSLPLTVVVIAACFCVAHPAPTKWPALLVVAFAMTFVRAVAGSLVPTIAMHVVFNAVTGVFFALGQGLDPAGRHVEVAPTVAFTGVTVLLLVGVRFIASRAALARRGRAEDAA